MKYIRKIALAFALLCFAVSLSGCSVTDGKRIIRIDRWYPSSLTCSVCGNGSALDAKVIMTGM